MVVDPDQGPTEVAMPCSGAAFLNGGDRTPELDMVGKNNPDVSGCEVATGCPVSSGVARSYDPDPQVGDGPKPLHCVGCYRPKGERKTIWLIRHGESEYNRQDR